MRAHIDPPGLFLEIVESITTRDVSFEDNDGAWGTRRMRPPGAGWRIDHDHERRTRWIRRRAVPRPTVRLADRWLP